MVARKIIDSASEESTLTLLSEIVECKPYSLDSLQKFSQHLQFVVPDSIICYAKKPDKHALSQLIYVLSPQTVGTQSLEKIEKKIKSIWETSVDFYFKFLQGSRNDSEQEVFKSVAIHTLPFDKGVGQSSACIVLAGAEPISQIQKEQIDSCLHWYTKISQSVQKIIENEQSNAENLISSMTDGVVVFSLNKEIQMINRTCLELFFDQNKPSNLNLVQFLNAVTTRQIMSPNESLVDVAKMVVQVVTKPDSFFKEKIYFPQGIFDLSVFSVVDHVRKVVGGALIFHDISKAEQLSTAKSEFVRIVSHRLRTPLSTQRWNFEMLLGQEVTELDQAATEVLSDMQQVNTDMLGLTEDLLHVSDFETGIAISIENKVKFDPIKIIDSVVDRLELEFSARSIKLNKINSLSESATVLLDPKHLERCLFHILRNALWYSHKGSEVELKTSIKQGYFIFSVKDQGIGISEQDQDRLFGKFFRGQEAAKMYPNGTGIGLYLCQHLIEQWNGLLEIESQENKGTTVKCKIPLFLTK